VSLAFDESVVLRDVSFTLRPGQLKVILGASGAGKSTILRLILGLLRPDEGEVLVGGARVDRLSEADLLPVRAGIGMVFQEGALFDSLTVRENAGYRLYEETRQPLDEVDARVDDVLGFVGLTDHRDRLPSELSGDERRRVAIARAMAPRSDATSSWPRGAWRDGRSSRLVSHSPSDLVSARPPRSTRSSTA
jgi:phospholipid/cholesterol/gamma-HCH transport system ATP-binding protein